jgi:hypothetical protein
MKDKSAARCTYCGAISFLDRDIMGFICPCGLANHMVAWLNDEVVGARLGFPRTYSAPGLNGHMPLSPSEPAPSPVEPARPRCGSCHNCSLPCCCNKTPCDCRGTCEWHQSRPSLASDLIADNQKLRHELAEARGNVFKTEEVARLRKELEAAKYSGDLTDDGRRALYLLRDCRQEGESIFGVVDRLKRNDPGDHEATISKLRAFSEGQAKQIRGLEVAISDERNRRLSAETDAHYADRKVGQLTRELERAKRGQR